MICTPYQTLLQHSFERRIPFAVHWELTYRCNHDCVHCYAISRNGGAELALSEIESTLDELVDLGTLFLVLTGGELWVRSDALSILRLIHERHFAYHVFTNGTLIDAAVADVLATLYPYQVEISLFALEAEVHDRITRQRGSCQKAMQAVRMCRDRRVPVTVKVPVLRYNVDQYRAVAEFALALGARCVFDYVLVPRDDRAPVMAEHGLSEPQMVAFIRRNQAGPMVPGQPPRPSDPLCGAGMNTLCISPTGNVYPCLAIRRPLGNIRHASLKTIWRSEGFDIYRQLRYDQLKECERCSLTGFCSRCMGLADAESGDLLGHSELACMAARAAFRAAADFER